MHDLALRPGPDPLELALWTDAVRQLIAYSKGTGDPPTVPVIIPRELLVPEELLSEDEANWWAR